MPEALLQLIADLFAKAQFAIQRQRDRIPRHIVFRRTQPSRDDHYLSAAYGAPYCRGEELAIVSHDALGYDLDSKRVQLIGEVERIRIHALGSEQFGADRDNLGLHRLEQRPSLNAYIHAVQRVRGRDGQRS